MQMNAPWLKPGIWGAIIGSVITMILGFSWMGWVLGGTAERLALERSNTAVVVALTPVCTSKFMGQPNAAVKLKELRRRSCWLTFMTGHHDRREVPELRRGERVCRAAPEGEALTRERLSEPLTAPRW